MCEISTKKTKNTERKKNKEELNKWGNKTCSYIRRLNFKRCKFSFILFYRLNAIPNSHLIQTLYEITKIKTPIKEKTVSRTQLEALYYNISRLLVTYRN